MAKTDLEEYLEAREIVERLEREGIDSFPAYVFYRRNRRIMNDLAKDLGMPTHNVVRMYTPPKKYISINSSVGFKKRLLDLLKAPFTWLFRGYIHIR